MRKPPRFWEKTFASLGFVRRKKTTKAKQRRPRGLQIETLEPKVLLATDLFDASLSPNR